MSEFVRKVLKAMLSLSSKFLSALCESQLTWCGVEPVSLASSSGLLPEQQQHVGLHSALTKHVDVCRYVSSLLCLAAETARCLRLLAWRGRLLYGIL